MIGEHTLERDAIMERTNSTTSWMGSSTTDLSISNANGEQDQAGSERALLLQTPCRPSVVERFITFLVRFVFAVPSRRARRKYQFFYILTALALALQAFTVVVDIFIIWSSSSSVGLNVNERGYLSALTETAWAIANFVSFTMGVCYIVAYDGDDDNHSHSVGFLPRFSSGESPLLHLEIGNGLRPARTSGHAMSHNSMQQQNADADEDEESEDGFILRTSEAFLPFGEARNSYMRRTVLALFISFALVTLVVFLDGHDRHFYDVWPTRSNRSTETTFHKVRYWIYFVHGFLLGPVRIGDNVRPFRFDVRTHDESDCRL